MAKTIEDLRAAMRADVERLTGERRGRADWARIARNEQLRPDECAHFALIGGRGSGKTRSGAEDFLDIARSGDVPVLHILAPTHADVKKVCIEGDSGVLRCARPGEVVRYSKTELEIEFANGVIARGFSGEEPDRLNGPQCGHLWTDEFFAVSVEAIDQALFGLRLGKRVTSCWTSTPKPTASTRHVLARNDMVVRRMRTRDNASNLAPGVVTALEARYGGTRLGRIELDAETLDDVEGALWKRAWFDVPGFRLPPAFGRREGRISFRVPCPLTKIVVALDPSVSDPERRRNPHKEPDACGMCVVGLGEDGRAYVLGDFTEVLAPGDWARLAVQLYGIANANTIVAEANQGGELIREVLRGVATGVPVTLVHATQGKRPRAEPVALLYEQGRVSHCGAMNDLEDQMANWDATDGSAKSPNNMDALTWGFHGLGLCVATGGRSRRLRVNGQRELAL
ncbi:MAG: terminase large subunit domain-containing protein [Fimbriimonas sp.]